MGGSQRSGKSKMDFSRRFGRQSSRIIAQILFSVLVLNLARESAPVLSPEGVTRKETLKKRIGESHVVFYSEPHAQMFHHGEGLETTSYNPGGIIYDVRTQHHFQFGGGGNHLPYHGHPLVASASSSVCNSRGELCQVYSKCAIYQPELLVIRNSAAGVFTRCSLEDGSEGVCCRDIGKNRVNSPPLPSLDQGEAEIQMNFLAGIGSMHSAQNPNAPVVDDDTLENQLSKTQMYLDSYDSMEKMLLEGDFGVKRGTSAFGHLLFFQTTEAALKLGRLGLSLVQTTRHLKVDRPWQMGVTTATNEFEADVQYGIGAKQVSIQGSTHSTQCPRRVECDPRYNFYRMVDGTCNNLENPKYGAALTPLLRLVHPVFQDGIFIPRHSKTGLPLPSARLLSSSFNQDVDNTSPYYSLWVMQFGQFLDHDLSHVPINRFSNGSGIQCCTDDGMFLPQMQTHPLCFPIEIPANDGFYRSFRQRCMNFVRSMVGPREDCTLGYADQLNQITSHLDNSNMYGSALGDHERVREFRGGRLNTAEFQARLAASMRNGPGRTRTRVRGNPGSNSGSSFATVSGNGFGFSRRQDFFGQYQNPNNFVKGMLPAEFNNNSLNGCSDPDGGMQCFLSGDLRVNEGIGLTVLHVVWLREHNRIAGILQMMNPLWSDDELFAETRRLLNAEYQHIIYNEWLPIVVGRNWMEVYGILPQSEGYFEGYDPNINPGVSNAFAAAAFRMGHSLIQGLLPLINAAGMVEENLVMHEHINSPFRLRETGFVDKLLRTFTTEGIQGFDQHVTSEVTNRLFQGNGSLFGMDLVSLNIQRGRDHGIPGYNTYRELCQLKRAKTFSDFHDWISKDLTEKLSNYYDHVDDVDLFVGGLLERPVSGALVGPTFLCIIGDQFARARKGDRFAYDGGPYTTSFTPGQLQEIRKASFARILCDNSDNFEAIQPFAFIVPHERNAMLSCDSSSIPRVDLSQWRIAK